MQGFFDYNGKKTVKWSVIEKLLELGDVKVKGPARQFSGDSNYRQKHGYFQAKEGR